MTKQQYKAEVEKRWHGIALRDAISNWDYFEDNKERFLPWIVHFQRDPYLEVAGKCHNPDGTLNSMIWVMQKALTPDQSCLAPCLDFEENFQKVFVRRGLHAYLVGMLNELKETGKVTNPEWEKAQMDLVFS